MAALFSRAPGLAEKPRTPAPPRPAPPIAFPLFGPAPIRTNPAVFRLLVRGGSRARDLPLDFRDVD